MPMHNYIEQCDNYSDSSESLWSFKRDEVINNADVTNNNDAPSFKYKASIIGNKYWKNFREEKGFGNLISL